VETYGNSFILIIEYNSKPVIESKSIKAIINESQFDFLARLTLIFEIHPGIHKSYQRLKTLVIILIPPAFQIKID